MLVQPVAASFYRKLTGFETDLLESSMASFMQAEMIQASDL